MSPRDCRRHCLLPPASVTQYGASQGPANDSALGFIDSFHSASFPVSLSLGIFVDLTDGYGTQDIRLQLIDADELREPVWTYTQTATFASPKDVVELDFMLGSVSFPEPGEYRLQVHANNQFVIERRFTANKLEMPA